MSHERTIKAVSINVVAHPHSQEIYARIFKAAAAKVGGVHKAFRIKGDRFGMIARVGSPRPDLSGSIADSYFSGSLITFTQVNIDGPWIDIATGEVADESERAEIVIPPNLHPNRREFRFQFFLKHHLLVVECKNEEGVIAPKSIAKVITAIFSQARIENEFGQIEITILPDREALTKILNSKLRKITLRINIPNPGDDNESEERSIEKRLDRLGAKQAEETYIAKTGATLDPDDRLRAHARVAAKNGFVTASALQSGNKRTKSLSTSKHPHIGDVRYDPDVEFPVSAFERLAEMMNAEQSD